MLALLLLGVACIRDSNSGDAVVGELRAERAEAVSGDLALSLELGVVSISGGADHALELTYTSTRGLEPELDQSQVGDSQNISIAQPDSRAADEVAPRDNIWTARLADDLLWDVTINAGSARAEVDLDIVSVSSLALASASGDAVIGLSGSKPDLRSVSVSSTTGEIWLNLEGSYERLEQLSAATTDGALTVVLLGQWQQDVTASITSSTGRIAVHVPPDVAVQVSPTTTSGSIVAGEGFRAVGSDWISGPADAEVTLTLRIATTSGEIAFRVDERAP
jgi:hypothetical protein